MFEKKDREMEKVSKFVVKVIIDRAEHMNKKKIMNALEKAIENLNSKDVILIEIKDLR